MQSSSQQSTTGGTSTLPRIADLYDPTRTFEVRSRDVVYRRDGSTEWLARVYEPQGSGPFPAVLEIHGGAWNNNDRLQNAPLDEALAASGLVVVAVDFRLGAEGAYPKSIADVNYATRWLKLRAGDFNATSEALGGLGLSSGGHMIALSAMRPTDPRYSDLPLDGDTGLDGSLGYLMMGWPVNDPLARYNHARSKGRTEMLENHHRYFGDEATMEEANPVLILERGESVALPPALLFEGADDDVLAPHTAIRFAEAYGKAGGLIELALFPNAGHGYARDGGPNERRTVQVITSYVARQLAEYGRAD
jgi:acetyl esterase/lipase